MIGAYFYENEESIRKYILPNHALKTKYKDAYKCCACYKSLILCKGNKNIHHFRHCKDTTCIRYDKPQLQSKRRIHEEAKLQLQSWIEQERVIRIKRNCSCCKKDEYECYITPIKIDTKVELEQRYIFNDRNIFYDVAHLNNEKNIIEAFEIVDTHKTDEANRPEYIKWFEISASEIMEKAMEHFEDNYEIILNNERAFTCNKCVIKLIEKKIQDDIREEEIRCMRKQQELKKLQDNYANDYAIAFKKQQDEEARLLKEKKEKAEKETRIILEKEKLVIFKKQEDVNDIHFNELNLILQKRMATQEQYKKYSKYLKNINISFCL